MELTLFRKDIVFKDYRLYHDLTEGLDIIHRRSDNNEDYASLTGTKQQINTYLQDKPIISERLRTLNNVPKYRIINTKKEVIQ
jgi:hypothetical protein